MAAGLVPKQERLDIPYDSGISIGKGSTYCIGFKAYQPSIPNSANRKPSSSSPQLLLKLTKDIVETYKLCNPQFQYSETLNPKRFLTTPSIGISNDGHDNANSDLILTVNAALVNLDSKRRYVVKDILGHGTFGQVAKCWVAETQSFVAVKIIKNQPAYYQQALVEVSILTTLNKRFDPEDKHHIVRIHDYFVHQRHLCIAFELLDTNLYELIKLNHFRGLSLSIVQLFSKQILCGLALMKDAGIIHCDLKPENILLCTSVKPAEIKIIDFGSACMEDRTVYSYIQSRYYRSPEVLLGYQYTTAIDMWSFGCIVAELFLGLPLFPGASEFDLLRRMIKILGGQPPDYLLNEAKNTSKFFKCIGSVNFEDYGRGPTSKSSAYQSLTEEEYEARELKKPVIGKEYFSHMNLEAIVTKYPYKKTLTDEDISKESQIRLALIDFLRGLVDFDPAKRWSPMQAAKHPFVTGEPFTCPYKPSPETPHMPVSQNVKVVDHHPAGGHWFAAGLSPNISGINRVSLQSSPHYQVPPYAHASSYGSFGSIGSYNEGIGQQGSSYGSYGDSNSLLAFNSPVVPSGMNMYMQNGPSVLGTSPDKRRMMQLPHGNGLGISPGNFAPMSLGTSPSQFTPPGSYGQMSTGSPGHYGPPSPRVNPHGSPLSKGSAVNHSNRKKSWGYAGNAQSQEMSRAPPWQGQVTDGTIYSQAEENSTQFGGSSLHQQSNTSTTNRRPQQGINIQQGARNMSAGYSTHNPMNASNVSSHSKVSVSDKAEASNSLPDPGDWDPNYSEESLLEEDQSETNSVSAEFMKEMHLGQALVFSDPAGGVRRFNRIPNAGASISMPSSERGFVHEGGSSTTTTSYDLRGSYIHQGAKTPYFMPHLTQNSPSPLGQQQHLQRNHYNYGRPSTIHGTEGQGQGQGHHFKIQPPPPLPNPIPSGPPSPRGISTSWGDRSNRRSSHPLTNIRPSSYRGRKDYGRIA